MFASLLLKRWLSTWAEALDCLVFPLVCPICGASTEGRASVFCASCREELRDMSGAVCWRCAMPVGPFARTDTGCHLCRHRSLGFDEAIALGPYQGPIRQLCLRLKHPHDAWLARWLIDAYVEAHRQRFAGLDLDPRSTVVAPVPLHWRRRWRRGYNQSEALADHLARRLGLTSARPLRRVVPTPPLAYKSRTERSGLLKGAFRTRPGAELRGRTVLLVDDVLTTGATSGEAARTLKRAGARRVVVAVLGRA